MQFTRDGVVAADMAVRNFKELIVPVIQELNTNDAKQGYVASIICGASVELATLTEDFEKALDELVVMIKHAHKENRS